MADYTTEFQLTATQTSALVQPTTQTLPLVPSFAGTTTLNSVAVETSIGQGGSSSAIKVESGRPLEVLLIAFSVAAFFIF